MGLIDKQHAHTPKVKFDEGSPMPIFRTWFEANIKKGFR